MVNDGQHMADGDGFFDKPSMVEPYVAHQWFSDAAVSEILPFENQAIQASLVEEASMSNIPCSHPPEISYAEQVEGGIEYGQDLPSTLIDHSYVGLNEGVDSTVSTFGKGIETGLYSENGSSISSSMSQVIKDAEPGVHCSNNVDECGTFDWIPRQPTYGTPQTDLFVDRLNGSPTGCSTPTDHSFDGVKGKIKSPGSGFRKGINISVSKARSNKKGDSRKRSGLYAAVMEALERPVSSYSLLYEQPSIPTSETLGQKMTDRPCGLKSKMKAQRESKLEKTLVKKGKPKGQLTNVKSLTGTGMLDGVTVHYVSSSGKLPGVIKGSSYLCGCTSCKYSEELNADEFERHAGRKTSHPNNHIQFETGRTIFQVVQELKRTPESMVFDVIQTYIGSPISQEAFLDWKGKIMKFPSNDSTD